MKNFQYITTCLAIVAMAFSASGCGKGSGPRLYQVSGTLKVKGNPVPNVKVQLFPVDGKNKAGLIAAGVTDSKGNFSVVSPGNRPGAPSGTYKVALLAVPGVVSETKAAEMAAAQAEYSKKLQEASKKVSSTANKGPTQEQIKKAVGNPEGMKELNREMAARSKGRMAEMDNVKRVGVVDDVIPQEFTSAATSPKEVEVTDKSLVIDLAL